MPDLTRDEWDDMQPGYDANGGEVWYVNCGGCDKQLDIYADCVHLEEGDRWECEGCNIRGNAIDYYDARGLDINFDYLDTIAELDRRAVERHLLKG